MQTHYPLNVNGIEDPTLLPWTNGVPATGVEGSYPPWQVCVLPMQELVNLITGAGLVPSDADMSQVLEAVLALIHAHAGDTISYVAGNTRLASSTTAGLSLVNTTQAIPACNQPETVVFTTVNLPSALGTYANGVFTCAKAGWYNMTLALAATADSAHAADTAKFNGTLLTTSASGQKGGVTFTADAVVPPPGAASAGFASVNFPATRDILLGVGDQFEVEFEVTSFYNDLTNIVVLGNTNLTIAYLNPDS